MSPYLDPNSNPYDSANQDPTPDTKPLDEIIRMAIAQALLQLRVHLPGQVVKVRGNQLVDVQILLQTRYTDGKVKTIPPLQNVLVGSPTGQNWSIKYPIAVGDIGNLFFCDRSLDVWSAGNGGIVDPQDSRTHDITDAIFVPGLVTISTQTTDDTNDMILTNGYAQVRMNPAGTFQMMNLANGQELFANLTQLLTVLTTKTFTNTMLGPQPFIASTITLLNQILENLESLQET